MHTIVKFNTVIFGVDFCVSNEELSNENAEYATGNED